MKLVLLGAPGAGKGTQAVELSKVLDIPHISTGYIFREQMDYNTELGIKANQYISKGQLVPDDVTIEIIKDRIFQQDCSNGFILDGFPRTLKQAEELDKILDAHNEKIDKVLNICIEDQTVINRLSGRRVCPACGASYHIFYNPPNKSEFCNECNGKLIRRDDDNPDIVRKRLKVYHEETKPLIAYYQNQNKLLSIPSEEDVERSFINTLTALGVKYDKYQIKSRD